MQNNISNPRRSIYSNLIYQTKNGDRRTSNKTGDFKSVSAGCFANDNQCRHISSKLEKRLADLNISQDSSTQTSKTIIQLAQIETRSISPDSLNASPKRRTERVTDNTQTNFTPGEASDEYDTCESHSEKQKNAYHLDDSFEYPSVDGRFSSTNNFCAAKNSGLSKTPHRSLVLQQTSPLHQIMLIQEKNESNGCPSIETILPNSMKTRNRKMPGKSSNISAINSCSLGKFTCYSSESSSPRSSMRSRKTNSTYMASTISSENKNEQNVIKKINQLFTSRRGRSVSPSLRNASNMQVNKSIPYAYPANAALSYHSFNCRKTERVTVPPLKARIILNEENIDCLSLDLNSSKDQLTRKGSELESNFSTENFLTAPMEKIKDDDWNRCIQGLAEVVNFCRMVDVELIIPHMTVINQRVIHLLRNPRSHVCRTACQSAGHFFEFVRDTRRPEFDEIVDLLLIKTADTNKFIREDANMALDCMITHIAATHCIRAICSKGPTHKNHLVRLSTVRLMVCAIVINGPENILNPNNSEHTRKRIFTHLPKFLEDKNLEVRKFGERLYKVLFKEFRFDLYVNKYIEKEDILKMKKNLRSLGSRK